MVKVCGKNGVYAEVVQHSCDINNKENELLTVQVKYGLIIHAEFLRHRMLSRGVKSNRAIPMNIIRKEVLQDPYVPVWFGAAQKGMVADNEMKYKWLGRQVWLKSRYLACGVHWLADKLGAHKEWANRLLNPWQFVRETITATEWDNLYNLRLHKDAQKDIQEIVNCIYVAHKNSTPLEIKQGEWHVPYVNRERDQDTGLLNYLDNDGTKLFYSDALKSSAARCARSSYDKHDGTKTTFKNDEPLYNMLIDSDPKHASPVEHQGTPLERSSYTKYVNTWGEFFEDGVTHIDIYSKLWSGNFKGWVQHRQLLADHTCTEYKKED